MKISLLEEIVVDILIYKMNDKKDVWLDCDPGHDDMMAIILAGLNQRINLVGISTSAGNSTI